MAKTLMRQQVNALFHSKEEEFTHSGLCPPNLCIEGAE